MYVEHDTDESTLQLTPWTPEPWWVGVIEWPLIVVALLLLGYVIRELYWIGVALFLASHLWAGVLRVWRRYSL